MSSQHRLQDLLQAAKDASGLSVRAIAEKAGVSHGTVSNALNNSPRTHPITDEMLTKLAKGFGLPFPRVKKAHDQDRASSAKPTKDDDATDVPAAILADTRLLPEARAHLLNQYQLLLRLQAAPTPDQQTAQLEVEMEADLEAGRHQNVTSLAPGRKRQR